MEKKNLHKYLLVCSYFFFLALLSLIIDLVRIIWMISVHNRLQRISLKKKLSDHCHVFIMIMINYKRNAYIILKVNLS